MNDKLKIMFKLHPQMVFDQNPEWVYQHDPMWVYINNRDWMATNKSIDEIIEIAKSHNVIPRT